MTPEAIAAAFRAACHAELAALKPGNVHIHADGHGMTVADFEVSAEVAAPHIAAPAASVGERILGAVTATHQRLGQNTNLGIVLLCAVLAAARDASPDGDLREAVRGVLARLDERDAALAFQAIALANPGGLGQLPDHDVRAAPRITLAQAMALAAPRDRIAQQYVNAFADIFETGLPLAETRAALGEDDACIAGQVYWRFLTTIPDSHIARKYGPDKAEITRASARELDARLAATQDVRMCNKMLLAFDKQLKSCQINPGTSADLTVTTMFAQKLQGKS